MQPDKHTQESANRTLNLDRGDVGTAAILGILSLGIYVRTLAPGLLPGDSGEFQTLAYLVGHAHTTGYWVYLIMAKIVTFLPIGSNIAYRVNFFSALMGAFSVGSIYLCAKTVTGKRLASIPGALAFTVAPTVWSQAIIAEVYTAASATVALVLLSTLLWGRTRKNIFLFLVAALGGISLGIHASVSLFAPGIGVYILSQRPDWRKILKPIMLGFLVGLAILFLAFFIVDSISGPYSIIQTTYIPSISAWDLSPEDLDAPLERFRFLMSATQWRGNMLNFGEFPGLVETFWSRFSEDYAFLIMAFMLLGLFTLRRYQRGLGWLFGIGLLVYFLYTWNYTINDIYVFYVPVYLYLCTLLSMGISMGIELLEKLTLPSFAQKALPTAVLASAVLGVVIPFAPNASYIRDGETSFEFAGIMPNQQAQNWHQNIAAIVTALEEDTIALINWNDVYAYYYVAYIELGRDDLYFIEARPFSDKPGMADSLVALIDQNIDHRPIYTEGRFQELNRVGIHSIQANMRPKDLYRLSR